MARAQIFNKVWREEEWGERDRWEEKGKDVVGNRKEEGRKQMKMGSVR